MEAIGLDRKQGETISQFITRVFNDPIISETNCLADTDTNPNLQSNCNQYIKTFEHTYYFSISTGDRKRNKTKMREVFKEPKKTIKQNLNFDMDVLANI